MTFQKIQNNQDFGLSVLDLTGTHLYYIPWLFGGWGQQQNWNETVSKLTAKKGGWQTGFFLSDESCSGCCVVDTSGRKALFKHEKACEIHVLQWRCKLAQVISIKPPKSLDSPRDDYFLSLITVFISLPVHTVSFEIAGSTEITMGLWPGATSLFL